MIEVAGTSRLRTAVEVLHGTSTESALVQRFQSSNHAHGHPSSFESLRTAAKSAASLCKSENKNPSWQGLENKLCRAVIGSARGNSR